MMYIIRQSDKDAAEQRNIRDQVGRYQTAHEAKEHHWHVGDARPRDGNNGFEDVVEIYADGHELESVRQNYTNIPNVPSAHSMTWRREFAQFIYDHLPAFGGRVNETAHIR